MAKESLRGTYKAFWLSLMVMASGMIVLFLGEVILARLFGETEVDARVINSVGGGLLATGICWMIMLSLAYRCPHCRKFLDIRSHKPGMYCPRCGKRTA